MSSADTSAASKGVPSKFDAQTSLNLGKEVPQPPLVQMGQTHYLSETPFTYEMSCKYGTTSTQPSGLGDGDSKASNGYATELRAMPQNSNVSGGILGYRDRFDTTGQVAPPGTKPRVTATLWEDEGALCYQVEARGVCVARREDNHMINGTKLLNIAGMTRGRRDGILKSEKIRHVVKIGPMQMKGVWIPFERALDFANKEKITELVYPLFVHDIAALLHHPTNLLRTNAAIAAAECRKQEQKRPAIDRAHTFPTPPTSASSIVGISKSPNIDSKWRPQGESENNRGPSRLPIDFGLSDDRSRHTTPATTPPGTPTQSIKQQNQQSSLSSGAWIPSSFEARKFCDNFDPLHQKHGMEDIRQIVHDRLSAEQPSSDLSDMLGIEPSRKRARLDITSLEKSQATEQPLHASIIKAKASFRVVWEVEAFLRQQQFDGSERCPLGSVITLTGTARYAQALTVREYLSRTWPITGPRLLKLIEELIVPGWDKKRVYSHDSGNDQKLGFRYLMNQQLLFHVEDTKQTVVEIAQQLAWLGCVLRTSRNGRVGRSFAQIYSQDGFAEAHFELHFDVDAIPVEEDCCWHDLFVNPVIAYHFPISSRGGELGLEISIPMMAALGGASRAVEFEGGLLIKGFSSAFVPLRRSGDSIQWHLIRNEDGSRLSYWEVDKRCPGRALLDTIDQDSLSSTRAFLGWWEKTTTHLGTADVNYDNLDWCPTREVRRSATFSGGSIGFQNFVTGEMNFAIGPKDSKVHISRTGSYEKIIEHASITPAVLYDSVECRAWLVPSSAVIAHIAQKKHFRKPFRVAGKRVHITPADPESNVFEAAETMLLANGKTQLRDSDFAESAFCFKHLVFDIWTLLECLMDKDIARETSADPKVHMPMSKTLRGWEFMDLVVERSPIRQKETEIKSTGGNWMDLAADINAIVLFASGFEDVIRPAEGSTKGICHAWKQIPKGRDYLAAGVPMLNSLYEQAGSRLTKEHLTSTHIQWSRGPMLFEKCKNSGQFQCSCDRVQSLVRKSRLTTISKPAPLTDRGAVIFGQAKHSFNCTILSQAERKENPLYSQENTPLRLRTEAPEPLRSIDSTGYGSSSLPSLGSGKTISTSSESESEDADAGAHPTCRTDHGSMRAPKRPREEPEHTFQDKRTQVQHYTGRFRSKRLSTAVVEILDTDDTLPSTRDPLNLPQQHAIRRKPRLHKSEKVYGGARQEIFSGEESGVHSHIRQKAG